MKKLIGLIAALCIGVCAYADVTEDSAHVSGQTGPMCLAVRNDAGTVLAGTSGDYIPLTTDSSGYLRVNVAAGGATGVAEDTGRSDAQLGTMAYAVRDDALVANQETTTDLDVAPVRTDNYGALWTHPITSTNVLTDTAVIEAAAYASGDCIDAAAEVLTGTAATAPFLSGRITDVVITDLAAQSANIDVVFFNADPGNICSAINAAADIDDDDLAKVVGVAHVTDHVTLNDNNISQALNQNIKYSLASGTALYYALISRGTPTYGTTSDLVIKVKVELD